MSWSTLPKATTMHMAPAMLRAFMPVKHAESAFCVSSVLKSSGSSPVQASMWGLSSTKWFIGHCTPSFMFASTLSSICMPSASMPMPTFVLTAERPSGVSRSSPRSASFKTCTSTASAKMLDWAQASTLSTSLPLSAAWRKQSKIMSFSWGPFGAVREAVLPEWLWVHELTMPSTGNESSMISWPSTFVVRGVRTPLDTPSPLV
mmetsp:Transcript_99914/g.213931  ORF Transcript_99914/g.213931 Transcript_99914/m.213931 type:complete len:204 (+) Transcript_99914:1036-1647(+)